MVTFDALYSLTTIKTTGGLVRIKKDRYNEENVLHYCSVSYYDRANGV